jgi:2-keto-4-pentenoate hydratase/2-oxohepta-3-ene-1,7-dioic acid hydratase in catechol pathway
LIAYLSQTTLEPGDIIATGTPAGPANGRAPGLPSWYLKHGDVVECEIERIGMLTNKVIDEPAATERSWQW